MVPLGENLVHFPILLVHMGYRRHWCASVSGMDEEDKTQLRTKFALTCNRRNRHHRNLGRWFVALPC